MAKRKKNPVKAVQDAVKSVAKKVKKKLQIVYNRSTRQWERPKYMRKAEFERQLAEKEAIYVKRKKRTAQELFNEVLEKYNQIINTGLVSDATIKLEKDLPNGLFYDPNMTKAELLKQIQVAKDFLANPTSTVEGAQKYNMELQAQLWKQNHLISEENPISDFQSFRDLNDRIINMMGQKFRVDQDVASLAFSAYREAMRGGLAAEGMFDSETMISYTFAITEQYANGKNDEDNRTFIIGQLTDYVEHAKKLREEEFYNSFYRSSEAPKLFQK